MKVLKESTGEKRYRKRGTVQYTLKEIPARNECTKVITVSQGRDKSLHDCHSDMNLVEASGLAEFARRASSSGSWATSDAKPHSQNWRRRRRTEGFLCLLTIATVGMVLLKLT
jgi:hypothetical protein